MTKRMPQAIGLVVLGAVIGAVSTARAGASQRNTSASQTDTRLVSTPVILEGVASARFIHDSKAEGCWLEVHPFGTDAFALAPAPESSCKAR